jgi:hypothetical protein
MKTHVLTKMAMTVAALIVGGYVIYLFSSQLPLPGFKYALMAPYLSMLMAIAIKLLPLRHSLLWVNLVFGLIMATVNFYMGLSIIGVGLVTDGFGIFIPMAFKWRIQFLAALYSFFVVVIALMVSVLFIGHGMYDAVGGPYIGILSLFAFLMGGFGANYGVKVANRIQLNITK